MNNVIQGLRNTLPIRVVNEHGPHRIFLNPPEHKRPVIWCTGGVGDNLLSGLVIEALKDYTGDEPTIYTHNAEALRVFFPGFKDVRNDRQFMKTGAKWWMTLNTLSVFSFSHNFESFSNNKWLDIYLNYRSFMAKDDWKFIIQKSPKMENETGRRAIAMGLNRQTLIYSMLGLKKPADRVRTIGRSIVTGDYITIHDGFDGTNSGMGERSMKNWEYKSWKSLVKMIKDQFPKVKIVQIGGNTSRVIPGCDLYFVGSLGIEDSFKVLGQSRLHIDGESGLVHAARLMGVRSVVMFGPTPAKFFGYEQNINIEPTGCKEACWWLTESWMSKCPAGFCGPECMDSIGVTQVMDLVAKELKGGMNNAAATV